MRQIKRNDVGDKYFKAEELDDVERYCFENYYYNKILIPWDMSNINKQPEEVEQPNLNHEHLLAIMYDAILNIAWSSKQKTILDAYLDGCSAKEIENMMGINNGNGCVYSAMFGSASGYGGIVRKIKKYIVAKGVPIA